MRFLMHREKEFGLNNRKSLYSPLQPKPFLQIDRPLTSDKDPLLWRQNRDLPFPFWFLDIELILVLSKRSYRR
jgi:hypothetical protein